MLTPGNTHDAKVAIQTINAVPPSDYLVADKGYDSNALRSWLIERGTTPVIPSKSNRKVQIEHDRHIYRQRNVVERNRFIRWSRLGVFNRIFAELAAKGGKPDQLMIDATHLKAHRTAASLLKKGLYPDVLGEPRAV